MRFKLVKPFSKFSKFRTPKPTTMASKLLSGNARVSASPYSKEIIFSRLAFFSLFALQHRGQEASGITTSDGIHLHTHKGAGLVSQVYKEKDIERLYGYISIGHNRYSTSGGNDSAYNQPFVDDSLDFAFAHNGNLPTLDKLKS